MIVRVLTEADHEQAFQLGALAFGYLDAEPTPPPAGLGVGAFDDHGRLLAKAFARPYSQWWGGREVSMSGIAGVAVHPDGRGQGLVRKVLDLVVAEAPEPISVLYPTGPGIYRSQGWEVVGTLDDTPIPLTSLAGPSPSGIELRSATVDDLDGIAALYAEQARAGWLTRSGPSFASGVAGLLERDVVTVAVEHGVVVGYVSYDRGTGYRHGGPLRVDDCLASTPAALRALASSVGSWSAVVDVAQWRGSTDDLALVLGTSLPAPSSRQPWMLRVLDPVAAVAARGFGLDGVASFAVADRGYRLEVSAGTAELSVRPAEGLAQLSPRGLALLYAGVAGGRLLRNGLIDGPEPVLEQLFAGPTPEILDYF